MLPRRTRDFLLRVSILDELRAMVCDAVLEQDDSATMLADVAASFHLLIPLDRRGEAFRMHQLLRDTLRVELVRRDAALAAQLHRRAAEWYEAVGDFDRAVEHRRAAGDDAELERVVWRGAPVYAGAGRTATVQRWIDGFTSDQLHSRAALPVTQAWLSFMAGDMSSLRYWTDVVATIGDGDLPDGNPIAQQASLFRALIGAHGIEAMRADAARAYELDRAASPFRSMARYLEGAALRVQGRRAEARERLLEGESIGAIALPATQAHCLAQLAALAIDDDDWETARQHVDRLLGVLDRFDLRERPAQAVSLAVASLVLTRSGDSAAGRIEAKHSLFLVSMLSTVAPWVSIETRIVLARTFLHLGDVALARTLTREAIELLELVPDGAPLRDRLTAARAVDRGRRRPGRCARHPDDAGGDAGVALPADPPHLRGHRRRAVRVPQHGQDPGDLDLPQARGELPGSGGRQRPCPRSARRVAPSTRAPRGPGTLDPFIQAG